MAREDSTGRSGTGDHRWHGVSDARSRLRVVGSGTGDRGREGPHRSVQAAVRDRDNAAGGTHELAPADRVPVPTPEQTLQATPVLSNCPDCNAALAVLRIIPGRAKAEYWT